MGRLMEIVYTCEKCGATKSLIQGNFQAPEVFLADLPQDLPCRNNCQGRAVRPPVEIPVIDIRRKAFGKLVLSQESFAILRQTGVDLIMRYNHNIDEVTAWLE